MAIKLDISNLLEPAVGEHGLGEDAVAALDSRILEYRNTLAAERAYGLHAHMGLAHDAEMLENILRATQPLLGRFRHLVLLGIGGSSLGLQMLVHALQPRGPTLHVVDNTDPTLFAEVREAIELEHTLFIPVSKSGGTIETVAALGYFAGELDKAGLKLADHMLAVTDPAKGHLRDFAERHGLPTAEIPPAVGGRFSVLTAAGLAPAALMNIDIAALLQGAARTTELCTSGATADDWPATLGLLAPELCLRRGKHSLVVMPYSSRLEYLSDWFVQLWDESLGKDGKGQAAIPAVGASDQHSQLQLFLEGPNDKALLFMRVETHRPDIRLGEFEWEHFGAGYVQGKTLGEIINAQQAGTAQACTERERPNATLTLPLLDASILGELVMGLEIATSYAGWAFGVNPYDQPAVELGKRISRRMLGG